MTQPFPEQDKNMAMDQFLAEWFGNNVKTASAPVQEDPEAEKNAQVELFQKLASDNGIDLDTLSEEQIAHLWNGTFAKEASDDDKKDDEKEKDSEGEDDKKEEAKKEHDEKKEAMAKVAEATFLGKVMAHSLVSELRKISSANEGGDDAGEQQETEESKEAAMPPQLAKALGKAKEHGTAAAKRVGELVSGSKAKNLKAKAETAIRSAGEAKAKGSKTQAGWQALAKKHAPAAKDEAKKVTMTRAGLGAGAAGAAAAGAAVASKKKESSALDEVAMVEAVKMAAEAGHDIDEVAEKVAAIDTLGGLAESEKVASVEDFDQAVGVRALEFLEAAGYPVTWNE